jgi:parvulin-like peptidyl-prolyl isomerase
MRRKALIFLNCLLYLLLFYPYIIQAKEVSIEIKAHVNNEIITSLDIFNRKKIFQLLGNNLVSEYIILKTLIDEAIIFQIADQNKAFLSTEEVDHLQNTLVTSAGFQSFSDLVRNFEIDYESLNTQLKSCYLSGYFNDVNSNKYKSLDKKNSSTQKLAVQNKGRIQLKALQLVLSQNDEESVNKIKTIQQKLERNIPFNKLIIEFSEEPSASSLGWFSVDRLQKTIQNMLLDCGVGDIIGPAQSTNKILFLQITGKRKAVENEEHVKNLLFDNGRFAVTRKLIAQYTQNSYIKIVNMNEYF